MKIKGNKKIAEYKLRQEKSSKRVITENKQQYMTTHYDNHGNVWFDKPRASDYIN